MTIQLDDNDQALAHAAETLRRRRAFREAMEQQERAINFLPRTCSSCEGQFSHRQYHHVYGVCLPCYGAMLAATEKPNQELPLWPLLVIWGAVVAMAGVTVALVVWGSL